VATGAYKTSPYLTAKFIANIGLDSPRNYTPKFDSNILQHQNKTKQYAIAKPVGTGRPKIKKKCNYNLNVDNPKHVI